MTKKVTFFIGLNDKDSHVQIFQPVQAAQIVERVFLSHECSGATISDARGIYKHENGTIVTENTIMVQVFQFDKAVDIVGICNDIKKMLNQESIAVEQSETQSNLY